MQFLQKIDILTIYSGNETSYKTCEFPPSEVNILVRGFFNGRTGRFAWPLVQNPELQLYLRKGQFEARLNFTKKIIRSSLIYISSKASFEKNCFSAWASTLNMGLINKVA